MANIKDVAKLAGVSISTVSRVVNNSTGVALEKKEAVLWAMSELQYKPNSFAKALVSNKSDTIGLVVGDLGDPFFSLLMRGVEKVTSYHKKQLLVSSGNHDTKHETEAIRALVDRRCDALIVHSKALADYQIRDLLESQPASVVVNRKVEGMKGRCIYLNNYKAAEMAMNHLIEKGHRRIAHISRNTVHGQSFEDSRKRYQGYQDSLIAHGIIPESRLVCPGAPNEAGGYQAALELLDRNTDFTAIFAYNDAMAAGCLRALRERKIQVPNDISVIGCDDALLAHYLNPGLTTIRYPVEAMGNNAAEIAIALFNDNVPDKVKTEFLPELLCRESVRNF